MTQAQATVGSSGKVAADNFDIGSLFMLWVEAMRMGLSKTEAAAGLPPMDAFGAADFLADKIAKLPAETISDFAIKSYLALYSELCGSPDNEFLPNFADSTKADTAPQEGAFADAMRFSPLVAAVVHGRC